jgi:hypothetical protein
LFGIKIKNEFKRKYYNEEMRRAISVIPIGISCALTPLALLEYKYNRSHDELLANVLREDSLTYQQSPFASEKNIYQQEIEEIRKSSQRIKHWQSSGPREQLFNAVPKRWNKN